MFTEEILMMLFEEIETGTTFEAWAAEYDYANMTDQQIYAALPDALLPHLGDFGLNASWMHGSLPA